MRAKPPSASRRKSIDHSRLPLSASSASARFAAASSTLTASTKGDASAMSRHVSRTVTSSLSSSSEVTGVVPRSTVSPASVANANVSA